MNRKKQQSCIVENENDRNLVDHTIKALVCRNGSSQQNNF